MVKVIYGNENDCLRDVSVSIVFRQLVICKFLCILVASSFLFSNFQVYSIGIFHNDSSPTEQELLTIARNKNNLVLQSPDGFEGLDMNLQSILNELCISFEIEPFFQYEEYAQLYHASGDFNSTGVSGFIPANDSFSMP